MRKLLTVLTLSLTLAMGRDAYTGVWKATLSPDDADKDVVDTLTFKGAKFSSDHFAKDGFEAAQYDDNPSPLGVAGKFTAKQTNKAGDTADWSGSVVGGEMTGQLVVTKKNGDKTTFNFKASRQ